MHWFNSVYRWRSGASTIWLVMLTVPLFLLHQMFIHHRMSLPWTLLYGLCVVVSQISYMYSTSVQVAFSKTRFHKIWKILQPTHLIHVLLYIVVATMMSLCCSHGNNRDIVGMHGAFIGLLHGVDFYSNDRYVLRFPIVQQQKLFRIKRSLAGHLLNGAWFVAMSWRYFIPCYIMLGWLSNCTSLLDVWLLWRLFFSGALLCCSWRTGLYLFSVFHTENLHFPVVSTFADETTRLLTLALQSNNMLLKYLGYFDLHNLSLYSWERRQQVFGLTNEGRPLVWTQIHTECTSTINTMIDRLQYKKDDVTDEELAAILLLSQDVGTGKVPRSIGWQDVDSDLTRRHVVAERAKLWNNGNVPAAAPVNVATPSNQSDSNAKLKRLPQITKEYLRKKPLFSYFLTELPGAANEDLVVNYQLYMACITALTQLIKYSYTEDRYGVVQQNLSGTLELLLKAYQLLDKSHTFTRGTSERQGIKTAVQCGLAMLHETFKDEMKSLQLPTDKMVQLSKII